MTRRLVISILLLLAGSSCRSSSQLAPPAAEPARRPGAPAILVLLPESRSANESLAGLRAELGADYDVVARYVDKGVRPDQIGQTITRVAPKAVVLMNNPTVRAYQRFRQAAPSAQADLPVVVLLTSFLRESAAGMKNLTGVVYEVPLLTSLVNLRDLLDQPVAKVGVVHRASFSGLIAEQGELAAREGFVLVSEQVEAKSARGLRNAIEKLIEADGVQALWVLNDNALLDRRMLERGWLPALRGRRIPVLVNAASLLSTSRTFGTFAVLPDHRALGAQAANLVLQAVEEGRIADLEYPLTVEKALDVGFARDNLALREDRLGTVERLVR